MMPVEIIICMDFRFEMAEKENARKEEVKVAIVCVYVCERDCYFGNLFSVFGWNFFSDSLFLSLWRPPVVYWLHFIGDGNEYKCENRAHSLMSWHIHTLALTPLCMRCVQNFTHIFFCHSLRYLYALLWEKPVPHPLTHVFHIAIFLIFTLSSIIKFYGFLCEQKENRVP